MKKAVSFILALILVSMLLLPVGAEENASSMLVTKGALTYEEKYFFDEEELRQAKRAGLAAQLFRKGMVPDTVSNELNYYIPEEDFEKLTRGMSNTVKNEVIALEMKKWGGSCYGMVRVAAI